MTFYVDINIILAMSRQPEVSSETTLCLDVQRAARALARRFDEALRPLGLTNGQLSLMMALNRPDPPTISTVAAFLAIDRTTLTAALKPLERRGLVEVVQNPRDRRSRVMKLTAAGRVVLAQAVPIWREVHADVEQHLAGEAETLRALLNGISRLPPEPRKILPVKP